MRETRSPLVLEIVVLVLIGVGCGAAHVRRRSSARLRRRRRFGWRCRSAARNRGNRPCEAAPPKARRRLFRRGEFRLQPHDRVFELLVLRLDLAGRERRIDGGQLARQSGARALIDRLPHFGAGVRQRGNRPPEDRRVVRHGNDFTNPRAPEKGLILKRIADKDCIVALRTGRK